MCSLPSLPHTSQSGSAFGGGRSAQLMPFLSVSWWVVWYKVVDDEQHSPSAAQSSGWVVV